MDDPLSPQEPVNIPPPISAPAPPPFSPPPPPPPTFLAPPPIISVPPPSRPRGGGGIWKLLTLVLVVLLCFSLFSNFVVGFSRGFVTHGRASMERTRSLEEVVVESKDTSKSTGHKIAVVEINGIISGSGMDGRDMNLVDYVAEQLRAAGKDSDVKAVILKVDSPGGEVLASDEINSAIRDFQTNYSKPVIASMGSLAASGGYYVSVPCRWIVANELTITGSIGVIMHGFNYRNLMDKVGIQPKVFKSGKFKDMLSGDREPDVDKLTPDERKEREEEEQMVQSLINETYGKFKKVVADGRSWSASQNGDSGRKLVDDWKDYADGRVFSGRQALDLGFVDELGDFETAVARAKKLAHISDAYLIEYRMPVDLGSVLSHLVGKTEVPALKIDLGVDLPKLEAGRMYFITPTAVLH